MLSITNERVFQGRGDVHLRATQLDALAERVVVKARPAVQGDRQARAVGDLLEPVVGDVHLALVDAVGGPDRRGERGQLDLLAERHGLVGVGQVGVVLGDEDVVLDADDLAHLRLDGHAGRLGHFADLFGHREVLVIRQVRCINHHAGPSRLDALPHHVQVAAVV